METCINDITGTLEKLSMEITLIASECILAYGFGVLVWLIFYFHALWGKVELLTYPKPSRLVFNLFTKFQICILKTVQMHAELAFLESLFLSPLA